MCIFFPKLKSSHAWISSCTYFSQQLEHLIQIRKRDCLTYQKTWTKFSERKIKKTVFVCRGGISRKKMAPSLIATFNTQKQFLSFCQFSLTMSTNFNFNIKMQLQNVFPTSQREENPQVNSTPSDSKTYYILVFKKLTQGPTTCYKQDRLKV